MTLETNFGTSENNIKIPNGFKRFGKYGYETLSRGRGYIYASVKDNFIENVEQAREFLIQWYNNPITKKRFIESMSENSLEEKQFRLFYAASVENIDMADMIFLSEKNMPKNVGGDTLGFGKIKVGTNEEYGDGLLEDRVVVHELAHVFDRHSSIPINIMGKFDSPLERYMRGVGLKMLKTRSKFTSYPKIRKKIDSVFKTNGNIKIFDNLSSNIEDREKILELAREKRKYYLDPSEIYSRIMEMRFLLNLQPDETFTPEHYQWCKESIETFGWYHMLFVDEKNGGVEKFINLMNTIF